MHVTVLMAARDCAPTIGAALASVRAQSHADWDLLVVDGASTDGTADVARAFRDPRIRVLAQRGSGVTSALQQLLDAAQGPLVAVLDADDVAEPHRLERQVAQFRARPRLRLLGGLAWYKAPDGSVRLPGRPSGPAAVRRALLRDNPFIHSTVMMDAQAAREAGGYTHPRFPDYDLFVRLAARHEADILPEPLGTYLERPEGLSRTTDTLVSLRARASIQALAAREIGPAWLGRLELARTAATRALVRARRLLGRQA